MWPIPMGNGYGITVDSKGRIHLCGPQELSRFDPQTANWQTAGPIAMGYNGCMTDGAGTLWVGGGADLGESGLHAFSTDTLTLIESFPIGSVKGVSIDADGYVWGVDSSGSPGSSATGDGRIARRLDPVTGDVETYDGLIGAYSYSDMTGIGLQQAGFQPPKPPD